MSPFGHPIYNLHSIQRNSKFIRYEFTGIALLSIWFVLALSLLLVLLDNNPRTLLIFGLFSLHTPIEIRFIWSQQCACAPTYKCYTPSIKKTTWYQVATPTQTQLNCYHGSVNLALSPNVLNLKKNYFCFFSFPILPVLGFWTKIWIVW